MAEITQNLEEEKQQEQNITQEQPLIQNQQNNIDTFIEKIEKLDTVSIKSNKTNQLNTQDSVDANTNQNNNSNNTNSTNSSSNSELKVRIVKKNSLDGDVNASLRDPVSGSSQVRIVEKNSSETDVIASLRDPIVDYRVEENTKVYETKNETPVVVIKPNMSISSSTVEEGYKAIFIVTFDKASNKIFNVTFSSTNGTAINGDYSSNIVVKDSKGNIISKNSDGSYSVPVGETSLKVEVQTNSDNSAEGNETFSLVGKTEFMISNTSGEGTIVDNDKPTLTLSDGTIEEGSTIVFVGSLSNASEYAEEITLSTTLGTAETSDFNQTKTSWTVTYIDSNSQTQTLSVDSNGKFTLPAGITSFNVNIPTTSDTVYEGSETFSLSANATSSYITDTDTAVGTIKDDGTASDGDDAGTTVDNDKPTLSIDDINVTEGNFAIFTVSLSNESIQDITFTLSNTNGTATTTNDYTASYEISTNGTDWTNATSATITAGTTSIFVRIPTTEDSTSESDETFELNATVTSGDTKNSSAFGTATIIDDDNSNSVPTSADKTVTTNEDTAYVLQTTDFAFIDSNGGDSLTKIKITTLETDGVLQYKDSNDDWVDVTLNQEITVADITAGKLRFNPDANENGNSYTTFQFKVNDGTTYSTTSNTITVNVTPVNDAPILDLDLNNSTTTGSDYVTSYALEKTAVSIGDIDVGVSDIDDTNIESATITLTNAQTGDLLFASDLPTGITVSAYNSSTGVITLTGSATKADYEKAIEAIRFYNSTGSDTTTRIITVVVNDGTTDSNTATTTITVATNALNISTNPTVEEGKSAIFSVSLEEERNSDTKIYLTTSGTSTSGNDYNSQLMYESAPGVWSNVQNDSGGDFITIIAGQTNVDVKIKTINDALGDDGESLILNGSIDTLNSGNLTSMANTTTSSSTIITELPSLNVSAPNYVIESNSAIFEVGLTNFKTSTTNITLAIGGDVASSDYNTSSFQYSTNGGTTWTTVNSNIHGSTLTIPTGTTTIPSILVKLTTSTDAVSDNLESLVLTATTNDSGISSYGNSASDNTVVVEPLTLSVTEKKDGVVTGSTSITTTVDSNFTYVKVSDGKNGIVVDNGDGTLTYTPNTDFSGSDSFSYLMINKTTGETITSIANVSVTAVADTPDVEIGANLVVVENIINSNAWKFKAASGSVGSTEDITGTTTVNTSSSFIIDKGDFVYQTFSSALSGYFDISVGYSGGGLTIYGGTLSGNTITGITQISGGQISSGSVYSLNMSGYNTIIVGNVNSSVATISSFNTTQTVAANTVVYNVDINNALTDTDNQTTGTVNKEELQSVTLQVKDSSNTVIASSGFFNQGSYDSTTKTWTFTQAQLDSLKVTVSSTLATNGFKLEATATSKELSNNSTATKTVIISIIDSDDRPTIGDQTLNVLNAQASTNGTNINTDYSSNTPNVFSWDPSKSSIPELYANGQKVVITYDNASHTVKGTIDNGATTIFTTTITMADTNGTTLNYTQGDKLLGVVNMIDGDIILPGGGNQDYRIFQFTDSNSSAVVDALVSAHNLIEDSASDLIDSDAEHTVNTNNYYIGVDSNNMNAGQQLVFDFNTIATYDSITTHANEVSEINIKLFNFGSEKSGDELYITVITKGNIREQILLTQDSDYTSELEYTVRSATGNPIIGVEFLAGNNSSFKLGIESIGSVSYDDTFEMKFAYDISDVDGDSDSGLTTVKVGSGTVNTSLDYELDSKIIFDSTDKIIDGAAGTDTLILGSNIDIDFSSYANSIKNIEKIDLTNSSATNDLSNIKLQDILNITDSNHLMTILGDSGDTVSLKSETNKVWSLASSDSTYNNYINNGDNSVSLKIDKDISVSII
jgi:large repetitive protein